MVWSRSIGYDLQLFLYTIFKTNPEMYENVKDPAKTCKGLFEAGIEELKERYEDAKAEVNSQE